MDRGSFLYETGWFRSFKEQSSIDLEGNHIPWITYSAYYFLKDRLKSDMRVFEFGIGASTLYFSKHVKEVHGTECNPKWYKYVTSKMADNVFVEYNPFTENTNDYVESILKKEGTFDIIIIDGMNRKRCAKKAVEKLSEDGVIIWDNSNFNKYRVPMRYLTNRGFKRLDFRGMSPIYNMTSQTTIFYKSNNCLGI